MDKYEIFFVEFFKMYFQLISSIYYGQIVGHTGTHF